MNNIPPKPTPKKAAGRPKAVRLPAPPGKSGSASRADGEVFLTVKQVAARWQASERQVHRLIASGELPVHRFGRSVRIAERDVRLFELDRRRGS